MPHPPLPGEPGHRKRLSGDSRHPGITVGLDDVMTLQAGLADDM